MNIYSYQFLETVEEVGIMKVHAHRNTSLINLLVQVHVTISVWFGNEHIPWLYDT